MELSDFLKRADEILALGEAACSSRSAGGPGDRLAPDKFAAFRSAALSFFANMFGSGHPYYTDFDKRVSTALPSYVQTGIGILRAARTEMAGGWLLTTRGLLSAEIFGDLLEMADHLVDEKYKDAAAVIAGSSLEEHLRQLALTAAISSTFTKGTETVAKKADALNADLATAAVYSKLDQKSIIAWLDLRNKAAHGHYPEYDEAQVRLMVEGIRQFLTRTST